MEVTLEGFLASELPDDVRSKVIEEYRWINVDYDWWEFVIDEFIDHMQKAYGAVLEKEKIEFDLDQGRHVKYNGSFWMNVEACKDKVQTLLHRLVDRLEGWRRQGR